jgi:hypothetical protein
MDGIFCFVLSMIYEMKKNTFSAQVILEDLCGWQACLIVKLGQP